MIVKIGGFLSIKSIFLVLRFVKQAHLSNRPVLIEGNALILKNLSNLHRYSEILIGKAFLLRKCAVKSIFKINRHSITFSKILTLDRPRCY